MGIGLRLEAVWLIDHDISRSYTCCACGGKYVDSMIEPIRLYISMNRGDVSLLMKTTDTVLCECCYNSLDK